MAGGAAISSGSSPRCSSTCSRGAGRLRARRLTDRTPETPWTRCPRSSRSCSPTCSARCRSPSSSAARWAGRPAQLRLGQPRARPSAAHRQPQGGDPDAGRGRRQGRGRGAGRPGLRGALRLRRPHPRVRRPRRVRSSATCSRCSTASRGQGRRDRGRRAARAVAMARPRHARDLDHDRGVLPLLVRSPPSWLRCSHRPTTRCSPASTRCCCARDHERAADPAAPAEHLEPDRGAPRAGSGRRRRRRPDRTPTGRAERRRAARACPVQVIARAARLGRCGVPPSAGPGPTGAGGSARTRIVRARS